MAKKNSLVVSVLTGLALLGVVPARAQQASDTIVYNAKIVTVDDHGFNSKVGTIAQAMHIKDGKILHLGDNAQIRAMGGPGTKLIDLKGRTVLPGFTLTHEHPWDWNPVEPTVVKKVLTDDVVVTRFLEGSPAESLKVFPEVLAEAVSKAKPGQWIYIVFTYGRQYQYSPRGNTGYGRTGMDSEAGNLLDGKHITKAQLDKIAPNNPVVLRDVFIAMMLNQKAVEESKKVFPYEDLNKANETTGFGAGFRWMFQDVVMKDHYPQLVELMRLGMEWWAGYGMTSFSSNAYGPSNIRVCMDLDRKGKMPMRELWTWNWRLQHFYSDPYFLNMMAAVTNYGTDYFWFGGGRIIEGGSCTTAEPRTASKLAKNADLQVDTQRMQCAYAPGSIYAKLLYDYIKAGNRYVNHHTVGDRDIDNIIAIIVKASKDAGMTDDEIRAKRHAFDHSVMFPRPDQVDVFKKYNFYASGNAFEIYQASPAILEIFGEGPASWVVPKKRLADAGIYSTFEMDRALGSTDFTIFSGLSWMMNRKAWDGKTYASDQGVDRQTALKIATIWGAYYLIKENTLGSLEPGKWADFIVLDKDYMTVPDQEIANLRVLMTVVGGRTIHLVPSLAKEIGIQPAGAQVTLGGPAARW